MRDDRSNTIVFDRISGGVDQCLEPEDGAADRCDEDDREEYRKVKGIFRRDCSGHAQRQADQRTADDEEQTNWYGKIAFHILHPKQERPSDSDWLENGPTPRDSITVQRLWGTGYGVSSPAHGVAAYMLKVWPDLSDRS